MVDIPEEVSEIFDRAERAFGIGRWTDALESYEEVLALEADHVEARAQAGRCRIRLGRDQEGTVYLEAAVLQAESPDVVWLVELGEAYLSQDEEDRAAANFKAALDRDPNRAEAYAGMGVLYLKKRSYRMAQTVLEKAVALEHSLGSAHNNLAIVYCYLGYLEKAAEELYIAGHLGYPVNPSFKEMLAKQLHRGEKTKEDS